MYNTLKILAGKKHPQIKTQRFRKIWTWIFGWLVHQIISLYKILELKQNFLKNKVVTGKTPFFAIGPLHTLHSICLKIGFWQSSFVWKCILVLSTKKRYSCVLKRVCVFQKFFFKVKVMKKFKLSSDCRIKTCQSLKRRAILEIPSAVFRRTYALSVDFKMKLLRKSVFSF